MNAWSCEDCDADPRLLAARGHCGGRFSADLPRVGVDEAGRRCVVGAVVVPIAAGPLREALFHTCPLAEAFGGEGLISSALALWRRSGGSVAHLSALFSRPSLAALEAVEVIGAELDQIEARRRALEAS